MWAKSNTARSAKNNLRTKMCGTFFFMPPQLHHDLLQWKNKSPPSSFFLGPHWDGRLFVLLFLISIPKKT